MKKVLLFIGLCMVAPCAVASEGQELTYKMPASVEIKIYGQDAYEKNKFLLTWYDQKTNRNLFGEISYDLARTIPRFCRAIDEGYGLFSLEGQYEYQVMYNLFPYMQIRSDIDQPYASDVMDNFVNELNQCRDQFKLVVNDIYTEKDSIGLFDLPIKEVKKFKSNVSTSGQNQIIIKAGTWCYPEMPLYIARYSLSEHLSANETYDIERFYTEVNKVPTYVGFRNLLNYMLVREQKSLKTLRSYVQGLPTDQANELEMIVKKIYPKCTNHPTPGFVSKSTPPTSIFANIKKTLGSLFTYTKKECRSFGSACWYRNTKCMKDIILRNGKVIGGMALVAAVLLYAKFAK